MSLTYEQLHRHFYTEGKPPVLKEIEPPESVIVNHNSIDGNLDLTPEQARILAGIKVAFEFPEGGLPGETQATHQEAAVTEYFGADLTGVSVELGNLRLYKLATCHAGNVYQPTELATQATYTLS